MQRKKIYIIVFAVLIAAAIISVIMIGRGDGPKVKRDKQGRPLIGVDNPDYDPKEDPDNPFKDDNKDEEGNYYYENKDLGFSVTLPPEFIYFQTQRWNNSNYTDLEILVPTNDPEYLKATPPAYAKPLIIRIFKDMDYWAEEDQSQYVVFGEKNDKIYTILFWDNPSRDWDDKWTDEMKVKVGNNVKLLK
ncbi:hypothetical protein GF382_03340 [Candidatus Falkowbacteria bacterium]|nr:hypothetical protein [Candidatus Falkowbacteria bacterium]